MATEPIKNERAIKVLRNLGEELLDDFNARETHQIHWSVSVSESKKGLLLVSAKVMLLEKPEETGEDEG